MKKLLYVTHLSGKRVNRFWISSILAAHELDMEFHLACNMSGIDREDWEKDCRKYSIIAHHIDFERSPYSAKNIRAYQQMKELLSKEQFDIVHCNTPVGGAVTRLAGHAVKTKNIIYQAHGFHFWDGAPWKNWVIYYPVEFLLSYYTDALVAINYEDFERAKKFRAKKTVYVPGVGIDTADYRADQEAGKKLRYELNLKEKDFVFLSVGEVNANKNHQVMVRALSRLPHAKYIICGIGPLEEELKALAKEIGVADRLMLVGFRSDVKRFYQMADCFVFPSLREGLSVSLMEAMGCGVPVMCSGIRGNTDLVENGVTGYIIKNDTEDVAKTAQYIMEHTKERQACATAARRKLERFDLRHVVELLKKLYQEEFQA